MKEPTLVSVYGRLAAIAARDLDDRTVTPGEAAELLAAQKVVAKASAYRMIETGELHRALGLSRVLPQEIETARRALDDALVEYESLRESRSHSHPDLEEAV